MDKFIKSIGNFLLVLCLAVLATPQANGANKSIAPEFIPGSKRVNAQGLVELVERIPSLLIIDARISMDRRQGYIEGSISLPDIKTNCRTLRKVIKSKSHPVLFYCNGPKCGRSVKSVIKAIKCGYKNVYWFRGGFEEWKKVGYPYLKK